MKQYLQLLKDVQEKGTHKDAARENMPGTTSLFGYQFRHNLSNGFPLLTTKKLSFKNIVIELLFFLQGQNNIKYLIDHNCNIWNQDSFNFYIKKCNEQKLERRLNYDQFVECIKKSKSLDELIYHSILNSDQDCVSLIPKRYVLGDLGKQYGHQWRKYNGYVDQIKELITGLKNTPESRRHIITAWNPTDLNDMSLHPCHAFVQFNCRKLSEKYYLDCQLYVRSNDLFLGAPYNIASYALLIHIIAKICNMIPGELVYTIGDAHIYDNHLEAVEEQLKREPLKLPTLELSDDINWEECLNEGFNYNCIMESLVGYESHSAIKAELSTGMK